MKAELVDYMGSDLTVVNAARVSFDKASDWDYIGKDTMGEEVVVPSDQVWDHVSVVLRRELPKGDKKLINYLAKHSHWTPFSHPQITLRETVPIFVARQRFKHMVGFTYNEVSRRYVDDEPEFFTPTTWRSRPDDSIKQGSGEPIEQFEDGYGNPQSQPQFEISCKADISYEDFCGYALEFYRKMLYEGVAPEQARMVLPQSMLTSYHVTGSLYAFARAYRQRIDAHSQVEIQELAKQWDQIIKPLYPESWAALTGETK